MSMPFYVRVMSLLNTFQALSLIEELLNQRSQNENTDQFNVRLENRAGRSPQRFSRRISFSPKGSSYK